MPHKEQFWNTVKIVKILLSVMVVFIHANNVPMYGMNSGIVFWIENYIGNGICKMAVPFFFLLSGICTYQSFDKNLSLKDSWESIKKKLYTRIHSLVIPYIIWIVITWGGTILPRLLPGISSHIGDAGNFTFDLKSFLLVLLTGKDTHLWFLNNLIILSFLMPVIYEIMRHKKLSFLIWAVLLAANIMYSRADTDLLRVCLDYLTGVLLAMHGKQYIEKSFETHQTAIKHLLFGLLFLILSATETLIVVRSISVYVEVFVLFGMMYCFWNLCINRIWKGKDYSFWIYLSHGLFLVYIKIIAFKALPKTELFALVSFFMVPILVMFILICVAKLLDSRMPKFYAVLTGERS